MMKQFCSLMCLAALTDISPAFADAPRHNVILFVPDGLRAGIVTPETAPTFADIRDKGVNFANSHSLFPTFTMPNSSGMATGPLSRRHEHFRKRALCRLPDPVGQIGSHGLHRKRRRAGRYRRAFLRQLHRRRNDPARRTSYRLQYRRHRQDRPDAHFRPYVARRRRQRHYRRRDRLEGRHSAGALGQRGIAGSRTSARIAFARRATASRATHTCPERRSPTSNSRLISPTL